MRLLYSPFTGSPIPHNATDSWLVDAEKFRAFHSEAVWLYDPWTGKRRDAVDIAFDPQGRAIEPPREGLDPKLAAQLREFLTGDPGVFGRSAWFENHQLKVYARNYFTYLGDQVNKDRYQTLVISNVVVRHSKRRLGIYAQLLALFDERAVSGNNAICVENVGDPDHHALYESRGFTSFSPTADFIVDAPFWFFKLPKEAS